MKKFVRSSLQLFAASLALSVSGAFASANAGVLYNGLQYDLSAWATIGSANTLIYQGQAQGALIEATDCRDDGPGCVYSAYPEELASFMGLASVDPLTHIFGPTSSIRPFLGAAIRRDFYLNSGTYLIFDYRTLTDEAPGGLYHDATFFVLDGTTVDLGNTGVASDFGAGFAGYYAATDLKQYSTFLAAGWHSLSFGAMQIGDPDVDTALLVNDITLPEPSSIALIGLAAAGLGFARRRKA